MVTHNVFAFDVYGSFLHDIEEQVYPEEEQEEDVEEIEEEKRWETESTSSINSPLPCIKKIPCSKKEQQQNEKPHKEKIPKPKPSAAAVVFSEKLEEKLKEFKGITEKERTKWKDLYHEERILRAIEAVKSSERENPLLSLRAALRDGWEPSGKQMKKDRQLQYEKMKQKIYLEHRVLVDLAADKFVFTFGEEVKLTENLNEVWTKLKTIAKNYEVT